MSFQPLLDILENDKQERRLEENNAKRRQWQAIQENAPDIANFMALMNAAFGKPQSVTVKINGVVMLDQGEFDPPKQLTVPRSTTKPIRRWR
jgi:hypothetical protein